MNSDIFKLVTILNSIAPPSTIIINNYDQPTYTTPNAKLERIKQETCQLLESFHRHDQVLFFFLSIVALLCGYQQLSNSCNPQQMHVSPARNINNTLSHRQKKSRSKNYKYRAIPREKNSRNVDFSRPGATLFAAACRVRAPHLYVAQLPVTISSA